MATVHFLTHPEVVIDPAVPVPDWPLSERGLARMRAARTEPWVATIAAIFCSAERKARDTAGILAAHLGLTPVILAELGENDRSATGYLPREEFERTADAFFAHPQESVRGWERASDAQARIVAAAETVLRLAPSEQDLVIVAHGGVGALLLCHLRGEPISRAADQPANGGGNRFAFATPSRTLLHGWRAVGLDAPPQP